MKQLNKNILSTLLSSLSLLSFGQNIDENFYSLKNKNLFKYEAIVFKENYRVNILIKDFKKRFTPDSSEIMKAENIFLKNYHLLNDEPKSISSYDTRKMFYKYKRQFFGYINEINEKKVVIQLIDCSKPGRTRRILGKEWDKKFINHFSDNRTVKIFIYSVNLDNSQLNRM